MSIYVRSKEKEIGTTVKGTFARIDKGVASGFSRGNYLKLPETFNPDSNTWEAVIKFETLSNFSAQQIILHPASPSEMNVALVIDTTGKILAYASTNGSSWNILNNVTGTTILSPLTSYYIKMQYTGTAYEVYLSTDGNTFNLELSVSSASFVKGGLYLTLGAWATDERHAKSIDLSQSYININGERWWSGDSYTKVGSWIDDGVVSGFSSANYLTIDKSFDVSKGEHWEFVVKATTATLPTDGSYQVIFRGNQAEGVGFVVQILNKHLTLHCGSALVNGQFNIAQLVQSTLTVESNTTYWFRGAFNGSQYTVDVSTDEKEWVNYITVASTASIGTSTYTLGCNSPIYTTSIFTGSIDLSGCYININGERWWHGYDYAPVLLKDVYKSTERKYYKYGIEPNATVVGSFARIDKGVASGFTTANYLTLPNKFNPQNNPWEIVFKINLANLSYQYFLSDVNSTSSRGALNIGVGEYGNADGKLILLASSNSSYTGDIANAVRGSNVLSINTDYWVKAEFTGSAYNVYLSTDGDFNGEESLEISVESTTAIYKSNVLLGTYDTGGLPFSGTIDLTQSYIKINDELWWSGKEYTKVGSWIVDGVVSGFTTSNYLLTPNSIDLNSANSWEIVVRAKHSTGSILQQNSNSPYTIALGADVMAVRLTGNADWTVLYRESGSLVEGKWYSIRVSFDGSKYKVERAEDGGEYIVLATLENSTKIISNNQPFVLGINDVHTDPYLGSIDLNQSYIKINNKMWWHGTKAVETTPDDAVYSDVLKKRIVAVYKTGKKTYYKNGVEVPVETITDFGSTKYYKNIVTTKYWKEITTVGREVEYACYTLTDGGTTFYHYAKTPLGSDLTCYLNGGYYGTQPVSSSSQLSKSATKLTSVNEDTLVYVGRTHSRNQNYDLVIDATVTETIEGTPDDYTYTTEEVTPVEVTANDVYDYSEFVPSTQFDSSEIPSQLVYNLKYDLINPADWQAIGTITGHNFFGAGTFSEYISATREGAVTFNTPLPSGKYTWRFLHYSQVNHTFGTYKITATYEDGTTEVVYNSSLGDTAYGGGEKATLDLSLTFKKPVKVLTNYTNSWGSGSGCYGGSGNVQLFFDGSKQ